MTTATPTPPVPFVYPSSDGKPMAENTRQLRWITVLYGNLAALYADRPDVFVAGDNLWYPVARNVAICNAPDVYVVFGRPKGDRSAYVQCEENDVPLTVVFEILSPSNTPEEMVAKHLFYEEHGVEEYYVYDPDSNVLEIATRGKAALVHRHPVHNFVSPRMGIRFDLSGPEMVVYHPNGDRFLTFEDLTAERDRARRRGDELREQRDEIRQQRDELREQRDELREQRDKAQRAAESAQWQLDAAEKERDQQQQRLARVLELSRKARRGLASPEELAELSRLEEEQDAS